MFASAGWRPNRRWLLYARYDVRSGDITSTATPTLAVINAAEVIERDDAFGITSVPAAKLGAGPGPGPGPGLLGDRQRFAYRIDAVSHQGRIGANYAIGRQMSVDLSGRYRATRGAGDNQYNLQSVSGAFMYRFD